MSVWKLDINGVESTLESLGIQRFELNFQNLGEDTLVLSEKPVELNTPAPLVYGDTVKLIEDTTCRFVGTVVTSPRAGLPGQIEKRSYTCKNIVWALNRVIYEQDWHSDATNTYYKGRVKLGKDVDDARISIDSAITDVLGFAVNAGLSFTYNLAGVTAVPPDSEYVDITCFEAVKNLLQWAPSVATSVDYSTGSPVINFVKRASAAAYEVTATELQGLNLTPRHDLVLDGVVINYEILNNVDGETYTTTQQDTAGTTTGLNVLKQTIDLFGMEASSIEQSVDIQVDAVPGTPGATFWTTYVPGLSQVTNISITPGTTPGTYPNILRSGSLASWMDVNWSEEEFTAKVSGTLNGKTFTDEQIACTLVLTDATTKTYRQIVSGSYTAPEDVPAGLAAQILGERSTLPYDGTLMIVGNEPDFDAATSKVCNILPGGVAETWDDGLSWGDAEQWLDTTDGFAGLDAIRGVIESVKIIRNPKGCTTQITIGPPKHLGAQDFIALARATRTRAASTWSRKEPAGTDSGSVSVGGGTQNHNGTMLATGLPATTGKSAGMVLQLSDDGEGGTDIAWDWMRWR